MAPSSICETTAFEIQTMDMPTPSKKASYIIVINKLMMEFKFLKLLQLFITHLPVLQAREILPANDLPRHPAQLAQG